jgi:hypothetical protein
MVSRMGLVGIILSLNIHNCEISFPQGDKSLSEPSVVLYDNGLYDTGVDSSTEIGSNVTALYDSSYNKK